jgi:serine/threonine protein kinase
VSEAEPKLEMTRLGSYTIVRKLAKGGMAEIYLARSVGPEGFEKLVVLKRILPKYAENPRFVQLFLDEAKLAASLDHPHIVHVYDMGRVDGHYFFTMEYVHGQDVRSILRKASRSKHPLPIAIAVQIARTMASALHHAHERKKPDGTSREVVHRDVSPSNILVSYDGAVKLADFGVAKAASSTVRTRTGALKGKVGYMSPEQARGMPIDRRSDIFSLGVVLWELVSMRRLFKSDNDLATIQAIINTAPPPLSDFRDDCPPELDRIARRALEKDPAARYQSAQQVQRDLDELARELKLDQSSIAISHFMNELFETEIAAWREAQASGSTVTDFIVAHSSPASATPVSESDFSLEDQGDEEEGDEEEDDDEQPEPTASPRQPAELAPRAGSISRQEPEVEDATDFGPPPTMEHVPPRPLAATVPRVKPPVIPTKIPPGPDTVRDENPFDTATTRLRPNPLNNEEPNPFNEAPTSVAAPLFGEEMPTVQAPPDILKRAFAETAETVQGAPRYTDPARFPDVAFPTPAPPTRDDDRFGKGDPPTGDMFGKGDLPTTPFGKSTPDTAPYPMQPSPSVQVTPQTPPVGVPAMPYGKVGSGTERVTPLPPSLPIVPLPSSQPAMLGPEPMAGHGMPGQMMQPMSPMQPGARHPTDGGAMPPGMQPMQQGSMPNMQAMSPHPIQSPYPGIHPHAMYPGLDPNLDIDLAPNRRRWFIIAGVAVGLALLAIILILALSGGPDEEPAEDEPAVEPAPKKSEAPPPAPAPAKAPAAAKAAVKPEPKPIAKPVAAAPEAGSGSGSAAPKPEVAAAPVEPVVAKPLPKITKQPPLRRTTKRR